MREPEKPALNLLRIAELDGIEAFVGGCAREENPFTPENDLHAAWDGGWLEAQAHHE